jgi:hypothetical protein
MNVVDAKAGAVTQRKWIYILPKMNRLPRRLDSSSESATVSQILYFTVSSVLFSTIRTNPLFYG